MKLTHPFILNRALPEILEGVENIDQFLRNLRKYAKSLRLPSEIDAINAGLAKRGNDELKAVGDGFELFGEFFVTSMIAGHDDRLYLKNYQLLDISDNGIDAYAEDARDGRPVFIQYKCYNGHEILSGHKSHIDSFVAECFMVSQDMCKVPMELKEWPRMLVITSALEMARYTKEEKYRNRVEVFPIASLKQLTSSPTFWEAFRAAVTN